MSEVIIKLTTPIEAGDETITEVTIKAPTADICRKIGRLPYVFDANSADPMPNLDICAKYLVHCAGLTNNIVNRMDAGDLQVCAFTIMRFFTPALYRHANDLFNSASI